MKRLFLLFAFLLLLPTTAALLSTDLPPRTVLLGANDIVQSSPFTGGFLYSHPLEALPGPNGMKPAVSLGYHSQRLSSPSVVGLGWALAPEDYVQREHNETVNNSGVIFRLSLAGASHTLIFSPGESRFRARTDPTLFVENRSAADNSKGVLWLVRTKDGATYRFGSRNESEAVSNATGEVWRWYLDQANDTHGNAIHYRYREDPFANDTGATYLWNITYGNDRSVVNLTYEPADRPDLIQHLFNRHNLTLSRRLTNVSMLSNGSLVRRYALAYATLDVNASGLASITAYGSDGVSALPATAFAYKPVTTGWTAVGGAWKVPICMDSNARVLDANGDGRADILYVGTGGGGSCTSPSPYTWSSSPDGWAGQSWSPPYCHDIKTRYGDVDADGLVDVVRLNGTERGVYRNTGASWTNFTSWIVSPLVFNATTFLVDVNGDGRADLIRSDGWNCDANAAVYPNNGTQWLEDNRTWSDTLCMPFGEHARIIDVNGDGLPDLITASNAGGPGESNCLPSQQKTLINNGTGWYPDAAWDSPLCLDDGSRFGDLNGDGRIDLFRAPDAGGCSVGSYAKAYLNTGHGWVQNSSWNPTSCLDGWARDADINGDGLIDTLRNDNCTGADGTVSFNKANRSFLLQEIQTSSGGAFRMDYVSSADMYNQQLYTRTSDLPFNVWLLASLTRSNGLSGPANLTQTWRYNYSGGVYDFAEKEFRGFARAEEFGPDGAIVVRSFHQDQARAGRELREEAIDSATNQTLRRVTRTWSNQSNATSFGTASTAVLVHENVTLLSGSAFVHANATYAWDNVSNLLSVFERGDPDASGDERYRVAEFLSNWSAWLFLPKREALLAADNATLVREANWSYDNRSYGEAPARGDRTEETRLLANGSNPRRLWVYDASGNVVNATNAIGRSTLATWDAAGVFPVLEVNPAGHRRSLRWDNGTGNLLESVDANGLSANYTYDAFGRRTSEVRPYDSTAFPTANLSYAQNGTAPTIVKASRREQSGAAGTFDSWELLDGFGRAVQTQTEADSGVVVADSVADADGRLRWRTNPSFAAAGGSYLTPNLSAGVSNLTYDPLGRLNGTRNPDGTQRRMAFALRNATDTDELGHNRTEARDALGRVVEVWEFDPTPRKTAYVYSAADELLNITDSLGNPFRFLFDSLGRKTALIDPDLGTWNYTYDAAGNLVSQRDGRGMLVTLSYDVLGRVTLRNASNASFAFVYDQQLNGTLSRVTGDNATTDYAYDLRLRQVGERRNLSGEVFVVNQTYDALDRPVATTSNGNNVTVAYGNQSQPKSIEGVLLNASFTAANRVAARLYANGLWSNFSYEALTLRVTRIATGSIQNLSYGYDNASNVLWINDTANIRLWRMAYDALDRLTNATRSDAAISWLYAYDSIGRMLSTNASFENRSFAYGSVPVHAPANVTRIPNPGLVVDSFSVVNSSGSNRTLQALVRNQNAATAYFVNWTLAFGDGTNATASQNATLAYNQTLVVNASHSYAAGAYNATVNATNPATAANSSIEVTV